LGAVRANWSRIGHRIHCGSTEPWEERSFTRVPMAVGAIPSRTARQRARRRRPGRRP